MIGSSDIKKPERGAYPFFRLESFKKALVIIISAARCISMSTLVQFHKRKVVFGQLEMRK
jgi:hypothetical protein